MKTEYLNQPNFKLHKIYYYYFLAFLVGSLTSLTFQPYNLFFLNFIIFPVLLNIIFLLKKNNFNIYNYFIVGCSFGYGFFLSGIYWITISLTFDENFKSLIPLALLIIPLLLSLFYGFLFISLFPFAKRTISFILIFSIFFSLMEYIRSIILTGFPWNLLGYTWSWSKESIQIISIIGTYSLGIFSAVLYSLPFLFFKNKIEKKEVLFSLLFIFLFLGNFFYGLKILKEPNPNVSGKTKIAIVSPGFSLGQYSNFQNEREKIKKLIELSKPLDTNKTIYIWPEGILTQNTIDDINKFKNLFSDFSKNHVIILGINNINYINGVKKIYNSLAVIDHQANLIAKYNKNRLVPFGEFLPFEKYFHRFGIKKITSGYESFSKGEKRNLIHLGEEFENINFLPLICYEIIYSGKIKLEKQKPDFIVNISEDAWFGNSIGPYQHFSKAVYRAIEERTYIARSANKGISGMIDPQGNLIASIDLNKVGKIVVDSPKYGGQSIFYRFGNRIYFLIILLYIIAFLLARKYYE